MRSRADRPSSFRNPRLSEDFFLHPSTRVNFTFFNWKHVTAIQYLMYRYSSGTSWHPKYIRNLLSQSQNKVNWVKPRNFWDTEICGGVLRGAFSMVVKYSFKQSDVTYHKRKCNNVCTVRCTVHTVPVVVLGSYCTTYAVQYSCPCSSVQKVQYFAGETTRG